MRPIKRFLVFATEALVLLVGVVLSFAVAGYFDSGWTFCVGLLLTIVEFFRFRRRTLSWKIRYDAVGFELSRAERRLHPRRARYRRIIGRTLLWLPIATAAFVLLFFPVATHVVHPGSRYFEHYRIPIPWTFTVYESPSGYAWVNVLSSNSSTGRFGMTPFWDREPLFSLMTFANYNFRSEFRQTRRRWAAQLLRKDYRLGDVPLTCWQYEAPDDKFPRRQFLGAGPYWEVVCETPAVNRLSFQATYLGQGDDIPAFYKIIEGVRPVE